MNYFNNFLIKEGARKILDHYNSNRETLLDGITPILMQICNTRLSQQEVKNIYFVSDLYIHLFKEGECSESYRKKLSEFRNWLREYLTFGSNHLLIFFWQDGTDEDDENQINNFFTKELLNKQYSKIIR